MRESLKAKRARAAEIYALLAGAYPDATCSLDFQNPLELMIATILAAQCTDARVNIVTKDLFATWRTVHDFAAAPRDKLETAIHACGFFRQKAKSIQNACTRIINDFDGEVPRTMEELVTLDGVGRKTANCILGQCFGEPAIIVDTHCTRLSHRFGFTRAETPEKIERELMKVWEKDNWTQFSHCIVFHGRAVCQARSPKCADCVARDLCPSAS
jgi:endonuclease-3